MAPETQDRVDQCRDPQIGRRAGIALLAAGLGVWMALPHIVARRERPFAFTPLRDPPGFRRVTSGSSPGPSAPLVGIGDARRDPGQVSQPPALAPDALCRALFDGPPAQGVVPIAFFTDYNCPYCRVVRDRLADLETREGASVSATWHEWPLLGPTSMVAARAALAAERQGAYAAFHDRLKSGHVVPTPAVLEGIATEIGIDAARLRRDMALPALSARLADADRLARRFGFVGTPGLIVGRTRVVGTVSPAFLSHLVDQERRDGPVPGCAV